MEGTGERSCALELELIDRRRARALPAHSTVILAGSVHQNWTRRAGSPPTPPRSCALW